MKTSKIKTVRNIGRIRTLLVTLSVAVCTVAADDLETLRKKAEAGDAVAQQKRCELYFVDWRVPEDKTEELKWIRKAAEQGQAVAQYHLGLAYAEAGWGTPYDEAETVKWYRLAAEQGYAAAQFNLGLMYANGEGVPEDDAEAAKWWRKAAEQGYAHAQYALGGMYEDDDRVPQDYVAAYAWYSVAIASGRDDVGTYGGYNVGSPSGADEHARWARDEIKHKLTRSQRQKGEAMTRAISERIEKRKVEKTDDTSPADDASPVADTSPAADASAAEGIETFAPMVWIKPGTFTMGSPQGEKKRISDELQHSVTLTKGFYIGKTEVTQAQWQAVMGDNPSLFKGANLPVEKVKWGDAVAFCSELTKRARKAGKLPEGYAYRLPTEAEWEYACRAGTTGSYAIRQGWYKKNSGDKTHEVGQKKANAWGLHDMHGNVWEWCQDWYDAYPVEHVRDPRGPANGSKHVLRGGSYVNQARGCRSATRGKNKPLIHGGAFGFRAVLAPQPRERL